MSSFSNESMLLTQQSIVEPIASLTTLQNCPEALTILLLQSDDTIVKNQHKKDIDSKNQMKRKPCDCMVTDEIFEHQRYSPELGTWGSSSPGHFDGIDGLERWFSPQTGTGQTASEVLPPLNVDGETAFSSACFIRLTGWHVDWATSNVDLSGWSYSNSFQGWEGSHQESIFSAEAPVWSKEHDCFSKVRRRRWVRLKCISTAFQTCKSWLQDQISALKEVTFRKTVVEDIWENQRYIPLFGWGTEGHVLLTDPGIWSNTDYSQSQAENPIELDKQLDGWIWESGWKVYPTEDDGTEADEGWLYATNFVDYCKDFAGVPVARGFDYVRRRRWVRTRLYKGNVPDQQIIKIGETLEQVSRAVEVKMASLSITPRKKAATDEGDAGKSEVVSESDVELNVPFFWERGQSADQENTWHELQRGEVQSYFQVRKKNYMKSRKKIASNGPLAKLVGCEFFNTGKEHTLHLVNRKKGTFLQAARARGDNSFYYVVVVVTPSPPYHCLLMYYRMPELSEMPDSFRNLWEQFLDGTDEFRNQRWKIIPRVAQGPWVVKSAVGTKPALLGLKVDQSYFKGDRYIEVDIDVGSSKVATMLTGLIMASMRQLTIDLAFTLEGRSEDELPEQIIGTIRLSNVDLALTPKCNVGEL